MRIIQNVDGNSLVRQCTPLFVDVMAKKTAKTATTNHHLVLRENVLWVNTNAITETVR